MKNLKLAVVELHKKGLSFNQIATELEISKSKAYRIFHQIQNASKNKEVVEQTVSETFQDVSEKVKKVKSSSKLDAEKLKLQIKLRQLELEHEERMKLHDFEEKAKQRKFELKNTKINSKIELLKQKNEELKERISNLKQIKAENYSEIEDEVEVEEDECIPEIDILVVDDICDLFSEIIETEKFYLEDIEKLVSKVSYIKSNILDWAENEPIEISDISEFDLLNKVKNVISDYQENFDSYRSFFGSTISMEFEEDLFSEMEDYIIQNSDK